MTAALLIAVLLIAAVLQRLTLKKSLERLEEDYGVSAAAVEPGAELDLVLTFRNRSRVFLPYIRYQTVLPEGFRQAGAAAGRESETVSGTAWLGPRQTLERRVRIAAPGRGRYALRSLTVYGGDFLGLRETSRSLHRYREVVVYPKEAELSALEDVFGGFLGDVSVRRFLFEDPVLTLGYLDYTGREPMKTISWTQSARRGALTVKNYDHTTEPSVSVLLNLRYAGADAENVVERCFELARAVCARLEQKGVKYDFSMNAIMSGSLRAGCSVPEGLGRRHFCGVLECLGRATGAVRCPPEKLVAERLRDSQAHGVVFLTPEKDDAAERAVRAARRGGAEVFIIAAKELM